MKLKREKIEALREAIVKTLSEHLPDTDKIRILDLADAILHEIRLVLEYE